MTSIRTSLNAIAVRRAAATKRRITRKTTGWVRGVRSCWVTRAYDFPFIFAKLKFNVPKLDCRCQVGFMKVPCLVKHHFVTLLLLSRSLNDENFSRRIFLAAYHYMNRKSGPLLLCQEARDIPGIAPEDYFYRSFLPYL